MNQGRLKSSVTLGVSLIASALLLACGGGGGINDTRLLMPDPMNPNKPNGSSTSPDTMGQNAGVCAANNPYRNTAGTHTVGTLKDEKTWIRTYVNAAYLWYQDTPTVDANLSQYSDENAVYTSLDNYFESQKSPLLTTSGAKKDKFSFIYPTQKWEQLFSSGVTFSYGIEWKYSAKQAPWTMQVAYVTPNSPAANAGVLRGDELKTIDGLTADGTVDAANAALNPSTTTAHSFVFARNNVTKPSISITPGNITAQPVLQSDIITDGSVKAGYLVFNEHIATAEQQLIDAVNKFKTNNVNTLILDLRYNGGGYLYIASRLAYMVAGEAATKDKVFEQLQYNDKRSADTANGKSYFDATSCLPDGSGKCTKVQPLPTLNLNKIYVIASAGTCSASESIINGLRGINVEVEIIGNTTCGKPYGFVGKSNCGISYFPMEFKGVNAKGFGEFADGFTSTCNANDDLSKPLGDVTEGMLAATLYRIKNPTACKPVAAGALMLNAQDQGHLRRPVVLENKIWTPR